LLFIGCDLNPNFPTPSPTTLKETDGSQTQKYSQNYHEDSHFGQFRSNVNKTGFATTNLRRKNVDLQLKLLSEIFSEIEWGGGALLRSGGSDPLNLVLG